MREEPSADDLLEPGYQAGITDVHSASELKGMDGTPVVAHLNRMHCWPDPQSLTGQWNWVQHKDIQDRRPRTSSATTGCR